jgi:hypothetical protein
VNLRHVYKIEWSYLKPYSNPDTPERNAFRLDRESLVRLLAKTRTLTNYEPGPQYQTRRRTVPLIQTQEQPTDYSPGAQEGDFDPQSPKSISDGSSVISSGYSGLSPILQSDFGSAGNTAERSTWRPRKAPPDRTVSRWRRLWQLLRCIWAWPLVWVGWIKDQTRRSRASRDDEFPIR